MRKTYNGAATLKSTDSACLDLFAFIGAARQHPAQAVQLFERAFRAEPALALRILLWARDARGGAGERTVFRNILHWLERRHPAVVMTLVRDGIIQEIGRWDDLLTLSRPEHVALVARQVGEALVDNDRLAAKWMPRSGPVAAKLAACLGLRMAQWRKLLVERSDTVEQRICAGELHKVMYQAVPSVAAARYQRLFSRKDGYRYDAYIDEVLAGRATMHAGAVFPHDILKAAMQPGGDTAATAQWSQLPRPQLDGEALVLCDVSGSMNRPVSGRTTAMNVCVALGLLLAESLPGPFRNQVLTFTSTPSWHTVEGNTLLERAQSLLGAEWGMSTNIQAAFKLILERAKAAGPEFRMPRALIVLSDMEFDEADKRGRTNHETMRRAFEAAGFTVPTLVYWNLAARVGNLPAGNVEGAVLVSGFSPRIAETVLAGAFDQLTPEVVMRRSVEVPRYDVPGLTC